MRGLFCFRLKPHHRRQPTRGFALYPLGLKQLALAANARAHSLAAWPNPVAAAPGTSYAVLHPGCKDSVPANVAHSSSRR